jgi:hypothetical protein
MSSLVKIVNHCILLLPVGHPPLSLNDDPILHRGKDPIHPGVILPVSTQLDRDLVVGEGVVRKLFKNSWKVSVI